MVDHGTNRRSHAAVCPEPFAVECSATETSRPCALAANSTSSAAETLQAALDGITSVGRLMLDLRELSFIDSTGLHLLVALDARSRQDGFQLTLLAPRAPADRAIRVCGLDRVLPFVAGNIAAGGPRVSRGRGALTMPGHGEREAGDLRAYAEHRDPQVRERLIHRYLPLANSIARRFDRGSRVPREDLEQIAAIGLLKALDRYDPSNGAAFSTFAVPTIRGEIQRHLRDFAWMVRPPRALQERSIRVEREREQLTNDLGRNPTACELAARVGCTLEELVDASEAALARASDSFDRPVSKREGDAATLGEQLGGEDSRFEAAENAATIDRLLHTLPERDELVLRLRFHDDLTQTEIARRSSAARRCTCLASCAPPSPQLSGIAATTSGGPGEPNTTPGGYQRALALD